MSSLLTSIGLFISSAIGWLGTYLNAFIDNDPETPEPYKPILVLFCIGLPLVGLGIGLLKRLIHMRG